MSFSESMMRHFVSNKSLPLREELKITVISRWVLHALEKRLQYFKVLLNNLSWEKIHVSDLSRVLNEEQLYKESETCLLTMLKVLNEKNLLSATIKAFYVDLTWRCNFDEAVGWLKRVEALKQQISDSSQSSDHVMTSQDRDAQHINDQNPQPMPDCEETSLSSTVNRESGSANPLALPKSSEVLQSQPPVCLYGEPSAFVSPSKVTECPPVVLSPVLKDQHVIEPHAPDHHLVIQSQVSEYQPISESHDGENEAVILSQVTNSQETTSKISENSDVENSGCPLGKTEPEEQSISQYKKKKQKRKGVPQKILSRAASVDTELTAKDLKPKKKKGRRRKRAVILGDANDCTAEESGHSQELDSFEESNCILSDNRQEGLEEEYAETCQQDHDEELGVDHETSSDFNSETPMEKKRTYSCSLCEFECNIKKDFYTHMKNHFSTGPPYQCDFSCGFSTTKLLKLLQHRTKEHTPSQQFQCEVCHLIFRSKKNLTTHARNHLGLKPFQCSVCGRSFATKGTLVQHSVTHSDLRPYLCDLCGFSTKYQSHLISHKRIHTGDVFQCQYPNCKYSTPKRSQLACHVRTHMSIRSHACSVCGHTFVEKSHLVRHEKIHLENKPFKCLLCDYSSTRRDKLKDHNQKYHPDGQEFPPLGSSRPRKRKASSTSAQKQRVGLPSSAQHEVALPVTSSPNVTIPDTPHRENLQEPLPDTPHQDLPVSTPQRNEAKALPNLPQQVTLPSSPQQIAPASLFALFEPGSITETGMTLPHVPEEETDLHLSESSVAGLALPKRTPLRLGDCSCAGLRLPEGTGLVLSESSATNLRLSKSSGKVPRVSEGSELSLSESSGPTLRLSEGTSLRMSNATGTGLRLSDVPSATFKLLEGTRSGGVRLSEASGANLRWSPLCRGDEEAPLNCGAVMLGADSSVGLSLDSIKYHSTHPTSGIPYNSEEPQTILAPTGSLPLISHAMSAARLPPTEENLEASGGSHTCDLSDLSGFQKYINF